MHIPNSHYSLDEHFLKPFVIRQLKKKTNILSSMEKSRGKALKIVFLSTD